MNLIYPLQKIGITPGIYLTQVFGANPSMYAQFGLKGHNGVDWGCPTGTPVYAVHDGIISFDTETTNYGTGYGKDLWLHFAEDGVVYECVYAHLNSYEGMPRQVKAGDVIAYSNNTGYSTGPHLHFGIRKLLNGSVVDYNNGYFGYIDPLPFFGKEIIMKLTIGSDNTTYYLEGDKGKIGFADPASFAKIQGLTSEQPQPTNKNVPQIGIFEQGIVIHN